MPFKDKEKAKEYKKKWNKDYYQTHKAQESVRRQKRRKELRNWLNGYKKNLSCEKCEEDHPACLEFHHEGTNRKDSDVSDMISKRMCSKNKILSEIKKCRVLCANCHRKIHNKKKFK